MTKEEAIRELSQYNNTTLELENIAELLERLKNNNKLQAIQYKHTTHNKSSKKVDLSDNLARVESIYEIYQERITKNFDIMTTIIATIELIERPVMRDILRRKYIDNQYFAEIHKDLNISFGHCRELHKKAVFLYIEKRGDV